MAAFTANVIGLTADEMAAFTTANVTGLTTAAVRVLSATQVAGFNVAAEAKLSAAQIGAIGPYQPFPASPLPRWQRLPPPRRRR